MNKKIVSIFVLLILLSIFSFCLSSRDKNKKFSVKKLWESKKVFKTPESVWYDKKTDALYISNINRYPTKNHNNGFISKVSTDGKIIKLKWVKNLDDPKGICTYKNKLYVSDVNYLVEINLINGNIIKRYKVEGAKFLNDVIADSKGRIYISDTSKENSVIYRFYNGKIKVWRRGKEINRPNGLFYSENILYVGNSGDKKIKKFDIKTKKLIGEIFVGTGIDGLILTEQKYFITSNWAGRTSIVLNTGKVITLLDTTSKKINSADLGFVPSKKIIIIPTFYNDKIIAYKLK